MRIKVNDLNFNPKIDFINKEAYFNLNGKKYGYKINEHLKGREDDLKVYLEYIYRTL